MAIQLFNRRQEISRRRLLQAIVMTVLAGILVSCAAHRARPTDWEKAILKQHLQAKGPGFSQPRLVYGKLEVQLTNLVRISEDSLSLAAESDSAWPCDEVFLGIWSAALRSYTTQHILEDQIIVPPPDTSFMENEYGNKILFWNALQHTTAGDTLLLSREFRYVTFDYRPEVDPQLERDRWNRIPDEIIEKYTRPERFLEQDPALVDTVFALLEDIADPVSQARSIYQWVRSRMTYHYPPEARGVRNAFETRSGDCGQYSALFITMARMAGIPARQQSGFNFYPGNTGAHVWSEIYLPVAGWVPVDATREDGFLHLDNRRLITSIGLNIPLANAPAWATFANSEVEDGHTDFMQMFTLVSCGIQAKYETRRTVLRSVEF